MPLSITKTFFLALVSILFATVLMLFPKESLEASVRGMQIWWDVVFPSLLPFFIVSELLIGFGVITFIGSLFEPIMRPFFRVPGIGGVVWAMGLASGNPAGAKITARLRQERKLTRIEAERLVCFTNSANPLFIFGAIAVGFFHNAELGILLALAHYLGNVPVGLMMRFYGRKEEAASPPKKQKFKGITHSLKLMHADRVRDGRPIGKLLGDAVHSSVITLLMIGGFIMLFSVINNILSLVGITSILASLFSVILTFLNLPTDLSIPLISGLFEITLGAQMASQTATVNLLDQVIVTSFILAFCGFSIQAQVASILAETDIRFKPFFIARIFHGLFASMFAFILWKPIYLNRQLTGPDWGVLPVFFRDQTSNWLQSVWTIISIHGSIFTLLTLILFIIISSNRALSKE